MEGIKQIKRSHQGSAQGIAYILLTKRQRKKGCDSSPHHSALSWAISVISQSTEKVRTFGQNLKQQLKIHLEVIFHLVVIYYYLCLLEIEYPFSINMCVFLNLKSFNRIKTSLFILQKKMELFCLNVTHTVNYVYFLHKTLV